jgi:hypothetical protein
VGSNGPGPKMLPCGQHPRTASWSSRSRREPAVGQRTSPLRLPGGDDRRRRLARASKAPAQPRTSRNCPRARGDRRTAPACAPRGRLFSSLFPRGERGAAAPRSRRAGPGFGFLSFSTGVLVNFAPVKIGGFLQQPDTSQRAGTRVSTAASTRAGPSGNFD